MPKHKLVVKYVAQGDVVGMGAAQLSNSDRGQYWEVALGNFGSGGSIVIPITGNKSKRPAGKITFTFSNDGWVDVDLLAYAPRNKRKK